VHSKTRSTDGDPLRLTRVRVHDPCLALVDLVHHLDIRNILAAVWILLIILHVPLIQVLIIMLKLWKHVVDHDFSAHDLSRLHFEHLASQEDVMGVHVHRHYSVTFASVLHWAHIAALHK
jgi:hypothetical protein